jgi:hypothetical protein
VTVRLTFRGLSDTPQPEPWVWDAYRLERDQGRARRTCRSAGQQRIPVQTWSLLRWSPIMSRANKSPRRVQRCRMCRGIYQPLFVDGACVASGDSQVAGSGAGSDCRYRGAWRLCCLPASSDVVKAPWSKAEISNMNRDDCRRGQLRCTRPCRPSQLRQGRQRHDSIEVRRVTVRIRCDSGQTEDAWGV